MDFNSISETEKLQLPVRKLKHDSKFEGDLNKNASDVKVIAYALVVSVCPRIRDGGCTD